jgi:2'-5' RNA ligase
MKRTVRTFVAVETDAAIRKAAAELIERLRAAGTEVKWVETENMHLTLKFLGEVPTLEIPEVCQAVQRGAAAVEPFEFEIRGAGAFPSAGRPRTVWLGSGAGEKEMVALHGHVEARLAKLGYRKEHRRFLPHLTLGRVRGGGPTMAPLGELIQHNADFPAGRVTVSEVVVFSSQLTSDGPIHAVLGRGRLGG